MAKQKKEDAAVEDRSRFSLAERRSAARSDVFDLIKKKYGKGAVSYAGTAIPKTVPRISSGMFILDYGLGGGWPRGRVNLLSGDRSTCKTTLLIKMLAQAQRMDIRTNKYIFELPEGERDNAVPYSCAFIDVEGVFDQSWAALQGVDVDALVYCRPDSQEEAGDIVEAMLQSKSVDIICVDSLAAMVPQSEIEGDMSDKDMGTAAKLNSKMFRKIQRAINASQRQIEEGVVPPTVFIINQLRQKIGVFFGDPAVKPGGVAQDFYASTEVRLYGNKVAYFDEEKKVPKWGEFSFKVLKNKVSPPKVHGDYKLALGNDPQGDFSMGEVLDKKELIEYADRLQMIGRKGAKWTFGDMEFDSKGQLVEYWSAPFKYDLMRRMVVERLCPRQ